MTRKTPSYKGLKPPSRRAEAASRAKRSNTKKGTSPERILEEELQKLGLPYEKNVSDILGAPDFVFREARVVVFCDGDFWHGRNWETLRERLSHRANPDYWIAKIQTNRERDERTTAQLERSGWHVVRFWETDIKKRPAEMARKLRAILERPSQG